FWFSIILVAVSLASCGKMDETYKDFIKDGTIVYIGKADSSKYFPGNERVKLYFLLADPKVSQAKIFWNNKRDSLTIPITKATSVDTMNAVLTNLEHGITERKYLFEIYTYDTYGNRSIKVQLPARGYGSFFQT